MPAVRDGRFLETAADLRQLLQTGSVTTNGRTTYFTQYVYRNYDYLVKHFLTENQRKRFVREMHATNRHGRDARPTIVDIARLWPEESRGSRKVYDIYLSKYLSKDAIGLNKTIPEGLYEPSWREIASHSDPLHVSHLNCRRCWSEGLEMFLLREYRRRQKQAQENAQKVAA